VVERLDRDLDSQPVGAIGGRGVEGGDPVPPGYTLARTGDVDELHFPTKGWAGVTLRTFDLEKRQWSIHWINSRTGTMFPPVAGGFECDRGEFYGEDEDDGRRVKVRFVWTKRGPDRAEWEQAFSYDGRTWEVNWTNVLTRADPSTCADHVVTSAARSTEAPLRSGRPE
jgi:hypothetical protein